MRKKEANSDEAFLHMLANAHLFKKSFQGIAKICVVLSKCAPKAIGLPNIQDQAPKHLFVTVTSLSLFSA